MSKFTPEEIFSARETFKQLSPEEREAALNHKPEALSGSAITALFFRASDCEGTLISTIMDSNVHDDAEVFFIDNQVETCTDKVVMVLVLIRSSGGMKQPLPVLELRLTCQETGQCIVARRYNLVVDNPVTFQGDGDDPVKIFAPQAEYALSDTGYSYVWADIETTGLEPGKNLMLELYAFASSADLSRRSNPIHLLIAPLSIMPSKAGGMSVDKAVADLCEIRKHMDAKVWSMHCKNGLIQDLGDTGNTVLCIADAITWFREWATKLKREGVHSDRLMLAGSSVDFDRGFMVHDGFIAHDDEVFTHRVLDVTPIKTFMSDVGVDVPTIPKEDKAHRAKDDIEESFALYKRCVQAVRGTVA